MKKFQIYVQKLKLKSLQVWLVSSFLIDFPVGNQNRAISSLRALDVNKYFSDNPGHNILGIYSVSVQA